MQLVPALGWLVLFAGGLGVTLLLDDGPLADWQALLWPLLPLSLARHVEALTRPSRLGRADRIVGAGGLLLLPHLLAPAATRDLMAAGAAPAVLPVRLLLMVAAVALFWVLLILVTLISGLRVLRALRQHRAQLAQIIAAPPGCRLNGVGLLASFLALMFGLQLLDLLTMGRVLTGPWIDLFVAALILGTALHGLTLRPSWPDWAAEVVAATPDPAVTRPSYARSGLDGAAIADLLVRLDGAMRRDALWRKPDLSLADLAAAARARPFYVSQTLNQGRGESFFDYVNRWRVGEAQSLLREGDQSVIAIAYEVGFNAKSTFNAAFRKVTGTTPSRWRQAGNPGETLHEATR